MPGVLQREVTVWAGCGRAAAVAARAAAGRCRKYDGVLVWLPFSSYNESITGIQGTEWKKERSRGLLFR